jgi:hypothetical protein
MLLRRALPAAHFDRNATTPVTDLVHYSWRIVLEASPLRTPSGDALTARSTAFILKRPGIRDSLPEVFRWRLE